MSDDATNINLNFILQQPSHVTNDSFCVFGLNATIAHLRFVIVIVQAGDAGAIALSYTLVCV